MVLNSPSFGCAIFTSISRAADCGCRNISSIVRIGPDGMPVSLKRSIQYCAGWAFSAELISAVSSSRFLMRRPSLVKRSSADSSGRPITLTKLRHIASLPTAILNGRSEA